jgi:formate hydrogenlyase subunit 3/multisubunit Na+/H+ antiporter MnhD subunit
VYADAIENFVILGASSLALYGMSRLYKKLYKNDPEYDNPVVWIPFTIGSVVFGVLCVIALFCSFYSINQLIAPEWAATQAVIELVKPK